MLFLISGHGNLNSQEFLSGVHPKQGTPSPIYSLKICIEGQDFLEGVEELVRLSLQQYNYLIDGNYFLTNLKSLVTVLRAYSKGRNIDSKKLNLLNLDKNSQSPWHLNHNSLSYPLPPALYYRSSIPVSVANKMAPCPPSFQSEAFFSSRL